MTNTKDYLKELREIAEEKGGILVSNEYLGMKHKLTWRCKNSHEWEALPMNVKYKNRWCPECSGNKKKSIEDARKIAKEREGECLSLIYVNNSLPLLWRCKLGHLFESSFDRVRGSKKAAGAWCSKCAGNKKSTIDEMRELAARKNGICLSDKYFNSNTKLNWQCEKGHIWEASPASIKSGSWCPHCYTSFKKNKITIRNKEIKNSINKIENLSNIKCISDYPFSRAIKVQWLCLNTHIFDATVKKMENYSICPECSKIPKITIEDMKQLAGQRKGDCLSLDYVNNHTKLKWICEKGHQWESTPSSVKNGSWCPTCNGNKKLGLEDIQEIAKERGGNLLTKSYLGHKAKHTWKCEMGHFWEATVNSVVGSKSWCPECANERKKHPKNKLTLSQMHSLAAERNGKCLSLEYKNANSKITWQCEQEHIFQMTAGHVKSGKWCKECSFVNLAEKFRDTIEQMQDIAKKRGGECLSKSYKTQRTKLKWKCANGHVWTAPANGVKHGTWCPHCTNYVNENKCRYIFEKITGKKFPNTRGVLSNIRYELDGYCETLSMAFEYQGIQHYEYHGKFHNTLEDFERQLEIDEIKRCECREKGIMLLEIPYNLVKNDEKISFIKEWLKQKGLPISSGNVDMSSFYSINEEFKSLQTYVEEKGGIILSEQYNGANEELKFKCKLGHVWETKPILIRGTAKRKGTWCPKCVGKGASIEEMQDLACENGGQCLSSVYLGNNVKLLWQCSEGHQWNDTPYNIKRKFKWCPSCNKNKKHAEFTSYVYDLAKSFEGNCISSEEKIINLSSNVWWKCKNGHSWKRKIEKVKGYSNKKGIWCSICNKHEVMQTKTKGEG